MAKQRKTVIDGRIEKLKSLGYESAPDSQGAYQTIREAERLTIDRKDIEYQSEEEWEATLATVDADHTKHIPFTETEEVPNNTSLIAPTMDPVKDIATFDVNEKTIAGWKDKYAGVKFLDLNDKANINLIKEGKKVIKGTRIAVEKREDFLKAPYIAGSKMIKAAADKYRLLFAEIETPLDEELERLKALEKEEDTRKAKEAEAEANRRVDVLKAAGMTFDGSFYVIGETRSVDYSTIKAMPLPEFESLVEKVKKDKEQLDNLEAERLKKLKEDRYEVRSGMLKTLGFALDEGGTNFIVHGSDLFPIIGTATLTDEEDSKFMSMFNNISARIAKAKQDKVDEDNKNAKARLVSLRSKLILAIGMERRDYLSVSKGPGFYFKNDFVEIEMPMIQVETATDDDFDKIIEVNEKEIKRAIEAAKEKEKDDADRAKISQDRGQQLIALGMTRSPRDSTFIFNLPDVKKQCIVAYGELTGQSPERWEETITDVTGIITEIKDEQKAFEDKAAKDKKDKDDKDAKDAMTFQERQYNLVSLGMVIVGSAFILKNEFDDIATISLEEVKAIDEDTWPSWLMKVTETVNQVKKLTEDKRAEKLAEEEALKPEVQRATEYINQIIFAVEKLGEYNLKNKAFAKGLNKFKVDMLNSCQEGHIFIENFGVKKK